MTLLQLFTWNTTACHVTLSIFLPSDGFRHVTARQVGGSETSNASSNAGGPSALVFLCRHTIHSIIATFCYTVCAFASLLLLGLHMFLLVGGKPESTKCQRVVGVCKVSFCFQLRQSAGGSHITKRFLPREDTYKWCQCSDPHFAVFIHQSSGGDGQSVYGGVKGREVRSS